MTLYKKLQILSAVLVAAGLAVVAPVYYFEMKNKLALSQPVAAQIQTVRPTPSPTLVEGHPKELIIPSLKMDLPIIDGYYDTKTGNWTLSLDKVQYATITAEPNNEEGNTFLYGHYRREVFARLHLIKPGASAQIITDNGLKFNYTYQSTAQFDPADVSVLTYRGKPRLTIQTCSGTFFQHRQMFYFSYDSYDKPAKN